MRLGLRCTRESPAHPFGGGKTFVRDLRLEHRNRRVLNLHSHDLIQQRHAVREHGSTPSKRAISPSDHGHWLLL